MPLNGVKLHLDTYLHPYQATQVSSRVHAHPQGWERHPSDGNVNKTPLIGA